MDSAVHATAAEQGTVGSVDDGIDIQRGDVGNTDFEPGRPDLGREKRSAHEWILAQIACTAQRRNGLQLLVLLSQLRLCPSGKIYRAAASDILKMRVKETSRRTLTEFAQHLEIVVVGLQRPACAERFVQILHSDTMEAQPLEFARPRPARQPPLLDEPVDEGDAAQLGKKRSIEADFVNPAHDLAGAYRHFAALRRINLNDQSVLGCGSAQKRNEHRIAAITAVPIGHAADLQSGHWSPR